MKTKQLFNHLCIGLTLLILGSCATSNVANDRSIQKRKYRKGWSTNKQTRGLDISQDKNLVTNDNTYKEETPMFVADNNEDISLILETETTQDIRSESNTQEETNNTRRDAEEDSVIAPSETSCDIIMLKNGEEIEAKVTEIGSYEIKYKLCDNLEGPVYTKNKSEVFKIKYANGTSSLISAIAQTQPDESIFNNESNNTGPRDNTKKLKLMAIIGIILGGLSFFIFGLFFSLTALGLGIAALILLNKKPVKERSRKVRNLSIWSIVLGAIVFALTLFLKFY